MEGQGVFLKVLFFYSYDSEATSSLKEVKNVVFSRAHDPGVLEEKEGEGHWIAVSSMGRLYTMLRVHLELQAMSVWFGDYRARRS